MEDPYSKCRKCRKFKEDKCPTSSECLAFENRPYFEPKRQTFLQYIEELVLERTEKHEYNS